jgi:hypothetical protein
MSFACIFLEKHFIRLEISGNFLKLQQIDPYIILIIILFDGKFIFQPVATHDASIVPSANFRTEALEYV